MTIPIPQEPSPIVRAFGGATIGYECPSCGIVHLAPKDTYYCVPGELPLENALRAARECCGPWRCDKHNVELRRHQSCSHCLREQDAAKEKAAYDKATKVKASDYKLDFVFRDGFGNDGYVRVDSIQDEETLLWAFGCSEQTVSEGECDLTDIVIEQILSDHHEDAADDVDFDKVKEASKLIFEACKDVKSFLSDESIVVVFAEEQVIGDDVSDGGDD